MPGSFQFFGLTVKQDENGCITIDGEEKLQALTPHVISRLRRKEPTSALSSIEKFAFQSMNGSLGFLGMTVSPFAAFTSSFLQQTKGPPIVHDLITQRNMLREVQRMGSVSAFRTPSRGKYEISIVMFTDAARQSSSGQLGYVGGLLIGSLSHGSIFHTISWASHVSKRPVKAIASAEVLASGDGIDQGKLLAKAYSNILGTEVPLYLVIDSKDLFSSLSTCRTPEDKSIRADVLLLRYNFETHQLNKVMWIPGIANPADPLTKRDSLMDTLQLMMFDGTLPLDFDKKETRSSDAPLV